MNKKRQKHLAPNPLHAWYMSLPRKARMAFRDDVFATCLYDKNKPKDHFVNWLYGKSKVPTLAAGKVYEAAICVDANLLDITTIFPNFKTNAMNNNIQKLLNERRWSQGELAEKAGVSRNTINLVKNQVVNPGSVTMTKIANAFELGIWDVFPSAAPEKKTA